MRFAAQLHLAFVFAFLEVWGLDSPDGDFDNTELLQTRVQAGFRNQQTHTQKHANLEQTVSSLSAQLDELEKVGSHQNPSGSWDAESVSLANFKTMIEDQLQVFIQSEHDQDQAELDASVLQLGTCYGAQRWETGGDVADALRERDRWQAKHQDCRASERAWLSYQTAAVSSSSCASEGDVITEHEILTAHATLANLVGIAQTRAAVYESTDPPGKQACALDQAEFEDHFCTWRTAQFYACSAAQDCAAHTGLSVLQQRLLERSANRRAVWQSLDTVLCRVEHLMGSMDNDESTEVADFNTTDICSDVGLNESTLVLSMQTPASSVCADHIADGSSTITILAPSTEDGTECAQFLQANYAWDQGEHSIPSVCRTTCPLITYTTWEVPVECNDEPAECQFYNHHRDTCGSYDSADFVAGELCCACGGGAAGIEFISAVHRERHCPTGYTPVTDEQECRDYAAAMGSPTITSGGVEIPRERVFMGVVSGSGWRNYPVGCNHDTADNIWFNTNTEREYAVYVAHPSVCRGSPSNNPFGGPGHKCPRVSLR